MPDASSAGAGPRSVAIVGPQGAGKSTLFDALMAAAGTPVRRAGEARERSMGTELRIGHCSFLGDPWALIDCPGSVEFAYETESALAVADFALVVCEPGAGRVAALSPLLHALEAAETPFLIFVNKIDTLDGQVRDLLAALQGQSRRPLVLRQVPLREGGAVAGYVDVVSERAYRYRPGQPSELVTLPETMQAREAEALAGLVEVLADHDDALLEKLVEDIRPTSGEIYRQLHADLAQGVIGAVLLGAADRGFGIRRLWKALRHDAPAAAETAAARGVDAGEAPLLQVFKTQFAGHAGRLSFARVWRGAVREGMVLAGTRVGGLFRLPSGEAAKVEAAGPGELVALARMEGVETGALLGDAGAARLDFPAPPAPVYALAIATGDRKDEVRLSGALQRLVAEDPSLLLRQDAESGETVLSGQGEIHLRTAVERLARASGIAVTTRRPRVPFRETIRQAVHQHGRLKRQTGGHGQFADVKLDIAPRARGEGFAFVDRIVGGAVPRQFIPAVGAAAEEATAKGPLGYPVVDVEVTLTDGGFHSVDSSDMAFRTATRIAMTEGLARAEPVLLEPIDHVVVSVPADHTPAAQRLLSGRRGQILGYAAKPDWPGWDEVEALVPQAELHDLIIELRSQTTGLGSYVHRFDHLAEAHGRIAERVAQEALAAAR